MSLSDTLTEALDGKLLPHALLGTLAPTLRASLDFDLMGVAILDEDGRSFEVVGVVDDTGAAQDGATFPFAGTVGGWVASNRRAFVGTERAQVRTFPETFADFERRGLESNCVLPLALGRRTGVLYFASARRDAYSPAQVEAYQELAKAVTPAFDATLLYRARRSDDGADGALPDSGELNLDGVQRRHITRVLDMTNWVIEGPYGAAAALGLAPSTLRHRMRKLGVKRPTGARGNGSAPREPGTNDGASESAMG